jgi:hypothetical protein
MKHLITFTLLSLMTLTTTAQDRTYPPLMGIQFGDLLQEPVLDLSDPTTGFDDFEFVGGYGEETDNLRFALQWHVGQYSILKQRYVVDLNLAANYSRFDGPERPDQLDNELRDVGLTPVFRFWRNKSHSGFRPFVEAGIGLHYLTQKNVGPKDFSTHFQFGDHIGIGAEFGNSMRYRVTYQFQHLSNAGIDDPNPGINFHLVSFGFKLGKR